MWSQFSRLLLFQCLTSAQIMCNDVHTTFKMGKTSWGRMTHREFCPTAKYVVGFRLRVHEKQGLFKDDTGLNGIQLICSDGNVTGQLTGPKGSWGAYRQCTGGRHVTGFNLRSERAQIADDAAATDVEMQCSDRKERLLGDGLKWGTWEMPGYKECPQESYFCGVQARIEHSGTDSTGLNQMIFICCHVVKGGWGQWTQWSSCSTTCNSGIQKRNRECNNPKPMDTEYICMVNETKRGTEEQVKKCHLSSCQTKPTTASVTTIKSSSTKTTTTTTSTAVSFTMSPAEVSDDGSKSFTIKLVSLNSGIRHYDIIVTELEEDGQFPRADPISYTNLDIMNNVDGLYVAGRVFDGNVAGKEFVVGGIKNGSKRKRRNLAEPENKALREGRSYGAFVRGYITENDYITTPWLPPVLIGPSVLVGASTQNDEAPQNTAIVMVVAVAVIALVVIVFLVWRRRRSQRWRSNIERNEPIEMNNRANNCYTNAAQDHDESSVNDYEIMKADEDYIQTGTGATAVSSQSQNKFELPIYTEISGMDSVKYQDPPPAYEEIQEHDTNRSRSHPSSTYQSPIPNQSSDVRPYQNHPFEESGYHELNDRAPHTNRISEPMPGYNSLGDPSVRGDTIPENNGNVYDQLNNSEERNQINPQQQGYDHLDRNTSGNVARPLPQEIIFDSTSTSQDTHAYESMAYEGNIYE